MVILTMASVQEQGENEQKKKSLMLYIAPAHQVRPRVHSWKPVLLYTKHIPPAMLQNTAITYYRFYS